MSILEDYKKEIGDRIVGDVLDRPCSKPKIDEEVRDTTIQRGSRYRGSVRITHGLFYTDKERQEKKEELLKVKPP